MEEEKKIEETIENPVGEETTEQEETSNEEQETSEEPETTKEDVEVQRDKLYIRLKKQEEKNKELKVELAKKTVSGEIDVGELAEKMAALSGLNANERQRAIKEAKLQDISLAEARKSKDFKLWRSAYRAELEKAKSPKPSTKQSITEAEKPYGEMTEAEHVEWAKNIRILDPKTGKYVPSRLLPRAFYKKPEA